jgi:DNA polymerase-4
MTILCRDCLAILSAAETPARCPDCASPRLVAHAELADLAIAHLDCDAFYANIEKRDDPKLRDRPVVVGGRHRGVVAAACYVARLYGVRSAMPMFKALEACPDAVVISPDFPKYQRVGHEIRRAMQDVTPLVEPLSIDEAFLDMSGTEALHGGPPVRTLAALSLRIERDFDLTVSIGLSYNKFLAKIASDLDKPRGFAVIGRAEARDFLADRPVRIIWGVGEALERALARDGISRVRDLWAVEEPVLIGRYGAMGRRLHRYARGEDDRTVDPDAPTKSISAETTLDRNLADPGALAKQLWPLCEAVARRLKRAKLAGATVTLKLKTGDFRLLTRRQKLAEPTQLAERLFATARPLLEKETDGRYFRLIGVGASDLADGAQADPPDLFDPGQERRAKAERAMDTVRAKLGREAIGKGRGLAADTASRSASSRDRARQRDPRGRRRS